MVLSNNDGCAIARSQEAKDLGVKMCAPYFQLKESHQDVWVRSSNYALYQDMMLRVTSIIRKFFPDQEIYSIDECFCNLAGYEYLDPETLAINLRAEILKCTGIPVCIGVARTKTLSKIANRIAKKQTDTSVFFMRTKAEEEKALQQTEIGDVWGIGRRHASRLMAMGVHNAFQFINLSGSLVQKQMTIVGLRMWKELRGESCIPMEYVFEAKKGIGTSRSFGTPETDLSMMQEAVATYASIAALKLRNQNSVCGKVEVYAHTSRFADPDKFYSAALDIKLPTPTSSTPELIKAARYLLKKIFKSGYRYQKVGIMLMDIRPDNQVQQSLFDTNNELRSKMATALKVMDTLNQKNGRDTVRLAASGYERKWTMKQNFLSQKYTTDIREVMVVKAK